MNAIGGTVTRPLLGFRCFTTLLARSAQPHPALNRSVGRWLLHQCNAQQGSRTLYTADQGRRSTPKGRGDRRNSPAPPHQNDRRRDPRARPQPAEPNDLSTGMAVTWLGTSSGAPTKRRNVSSIALRTLQQTILVDCGEATNRQMVIAGIDPLSVSNIFITHLHGDHCFGLPGMLTTISEARAGTNLAQKPLRIFGPPGLQDLVASTLGYSCTKLAMPIVVAEFTVQPDENSPPVPVDRLPGVAFATLAPDKTEQLQRASTQRQHRADRREEHKVDVITGLTWTIPCAPGITITAAQLKHRVPCWGYVAREADKPPSEIAKKVEEAGLASGEALELLRQGKKPSETISTPNGGSIMLRELLKPPTPGRKVVLLGDTCNSRAIAEAAQGADLLSHEATFSSDMSKKAHLAQHSTASMAGEFARTIRASNLILTHFSSRYSAAARESEDASAQDIWSLLKEAKSGYNFPRVFAAQDFFTADVNKSQPPPAARKPRNGRPNNPRR